MSKTLRVWEFTARTGLAERTVRRLIAAKRIPVIRPAGVRVVLIPEAALANFIKVRRRVRQKAETG